MKIKLSRLVGLTGERLSGSDRELTALCCDSRKASRNSAFFCINGSVADGHNYARSAYERGCRVFFAEYRPDALPDDADVYICPQGTRAALADASAAFYGHPEKKLRLIGITGTKGKTTTALMISSVLNENGIKTGYIGSNGVEFDSFRFDTVNTTPESCDIYEYLSMMLTKDVTTVVLEVSSQALAMNRIRGLSFETCVFTNLSPDHIGGFEHRDYNDYRRCKLLLFSGHCKKYAVINADDREADTFASAVSAGVGKYYFSTTRPADFTADGIHLIRDSKGLGAEFTCNAKGASYNMSLRLPGVFSVENALAATAVCCLCGLNAKCVADSLAGVCIRGRFEAYRFNGVDYIIDYAHNGVSLRSALTVLREYSPSRLICLFGSVGGRTKMRRPELGAAASELADFSILTSDNPDCESPEDIISDIASAYRDKTSFVSIPDRREAINYAVETSKPGDIILLAGKGHENYQLIAGRREPFSERDILLAEAQKVGV